MIAFAFMTRTPEKN